MATRPTGKATHKGNATDRGDATDKGNLARSGPMRCDAVLLRLPCRILSKPSPIAYTG
ncbi:hypothetical protein KF728_27160 [Candidatus Obscuribacterales bacterium]|nr:hypothetical protein [Candidatus Obscuribacterales bacterium]